MQYLHVAATALGGGGQKGVGGGLEEEIRSVGLQTMPHSQRGSRAFTA